jgi:hypothetical protein
MKMGEIISQDVSGRLKRSLGHYTDLTSLTSQLEERVSDSQGRGINPLFPPTPLVACKGDGTDDTTALQAIINYCQTNKKALISPAGVVYGISAPIQITDRLNMDLNWATIKAIQTVTSVIDFNVTAPYPNEKVNYGIERFVIDCNNKATYGIYGRNSQDSFWDKFAILNVTNYGIYCNTGYGYVFTNFFIQGNGQTTSCGIRSFGDSHFSHGIIEDCYNAIFTANYSFFNDIHAWLSSKAVISGSCFMTGTGGGSFNQVYSDTYQYAFKPTSNTNYLNINLAYVFSNPTIYKSVVMSVVPSFFYFDAPAEIAMVSVTNSTMWALSTTSGLTGGGIFMNQPLYQWTGKMHNCLLSGIQAVPDNIVSSLTLGTGWTVGGINRLTKKSGRVHLELDCYYSGPIPQNTNLNIVSFGNGVFPDGYYPKDSKKIMAMIGQQWASKEVCYAYLTSNYDHTALTINYSGSSTTLTYVTIDVEYEALNSI